MKTAFDHYRCAEAARREGKCRRDLRNGEICTAPGAHGARIEIFRTLSEAHGIPFAVKKRGGLSDANHIAACGPIFLDGLGPTGDFDHSPREYLELSTIEPNLRLAWLLLRDLADQKEDL